jgi:hypothetical protein
MEDGETVVCLLFGYAMAHIWAKNGVGCSGPKVGSRRDAYHKNQVQDAPFRVGQHNRQGASKRVKTKLEQHNAIVSEYRKWVDSLFPVVIPKGYVCCPECNGEGQLEYTGDTCSLVDYCHVCEGEGFVAN